MALQLATTLDNGALGNYWKITSVVVNDTPGGKTLNWTATLFLNKNIADNVGAPLGVSRYFTRALTPTEKGSNLFALCYTAMKLDSQFATAVNV